jgi:hypothetical protein
MCIRNPAVAARVNAAMSTAARTGTEPAAESTGTEPAGTEPAAKSTGTEPAAAAPTEGVEVAPGEAGTPGGGGGGAKPGGGRLVGAAKAVGPMVAVAVNQYLMAREDAKLVPERVRKALEAEEVQRRTDDLVDRKRLEIARKQHHGVKCYLTVRVRLVFSNGIMDRLSVQAPEITEADQSENAAPSAISHDLIGVETSVGWSVRSVLLPAAETTKSERIGFELEDLDASAQGGADQEAAARIATERTRLQQEQSTAREQEQRARSAEAARPVVIADARKRARQQAEITDRLNSLPKADPSRQQQSQPAQPPAAPLLAAPQPAAPTPLTLLPGAPGEGPIESAARVVTAARSWTGTLESRGRALEARLQSADAPTAQERQGFLVEEERWRLALKYAMNTFRTNGRDEAVNALGELLDHYGPELAQFRTHLGG